MKNLLKVTVTGAFLLLTSLQSKEVKNECNVKKNGIITVLETASKYNDMAKKQGLEFMRLGMKTSQYIAATKIAMNNGSHTVDILNTQKKKTGTVSTEYAAWRACLFAINAIRQDKEAKMTWKLAVPGDGYEY